MARGVGIGGGGALVLFLVVMLLGGDPSALLNVIGQAPSAAVTDAARPPANDEASEFVRVVLGYSEDTWAEIFSQGGATYRPPQLILYSGVTRSACGVGSAASGPFYCPADSITRSTSISRSSTSSPASVGRVTSPPPT